MNIHSYKVLEFNKLREELSHYMTIEENQEKILDLEPFKDINSLRKELEIIRDFMDFLNFDGGFDPAGMKDITNITRKAQLVGMYLEPEDLWSININLRIFRIFKGRLETLEKYKDLRGKFINIPTFKNLEDLINKAIDPDKNIKDDASIELRELRFQKKNMVANIKRKFEELFTNPNYSKAIQEKIITTRDGRSVIPVKTDFKGLIKGIEHDRSSSGSTVFIEPISIVSLNNKMRELEVREREEIRKILLRLTDQVRLNTPIINEIGNTIMYLDILNGKSQFGIEKKCAIPEINNKEMLSLVNARHPFINENMVVPLTFEIG
ncbi:MAG: endonuclease MutS2, partial [Cetobacterium somerae]